MFCVEIYTVIRAISLICAFITTVLFIVSALSHIIHTTRQLYTANPVQGVMIGREAYRNPWMFAQADRLFYNDTSYSIGTRRDVIEKYLDYAEESSKKDIFGSNCCSIVKPLHNVFHGCDTNTLYKRKLDDLLKKYSSRVDKEQDMTLSEVIHMAIEDTIPDSYLDEPVMS